MCVEHVGIFLGSQGAQLPENIGGSDNVSESAESTDFSIEDQTSGPGISGESGSKEGSDEMKSKETSSKIGEDDVLGSTSKPLKGTSTCFYNEVD